MQLKKRLKLTTLVTLKTLLVASCASCNGDPNLKMRLYQGDSAQLRVYSSKHGEVRTHSFEFDNMTCTWTEELKRELKQLKRYVDKCEAKGK